MSEVKIKIAVEVTEGYNSVFTHQEVKSVNGFSREKILECLRDFSEDMQVLTNRTKHMKKIEEQNLLTVESNEPI